MSSHQQQTAHPSSGQEEQTKNASESHQREQQDEQIKELREEEKVQVDEESNQQEAGLEEVKVKEEEGDEDELIQDDIEKAQEHKNKGGEHFKKGDQASAIDQYQLALKYTSDKILRSTLCSNIAICLIKEEAYSQAKQYCQRALKYNEGQRKARTNYARCLQKEDKLQQALEQYKKLDTDAPANEKQFIKSKISTLQPKVDQINEKRKEEVIDGLKNIGNNILGYFGMSLDNFKMEKGEGGGYNIQFKQ